MKKLFRRLEPNKYAFIVYRYVTQVVWNVSLVYFYET